MECSHAGDLIKPELSVRIVVCDHYLTKPTPGIDVIYSEFRGSDIKQVPILRIFGTALDGHKTCLHVHGVFPYFYLPCSTSNPEPQFLYQVSSSLDKALNIALKQATSTNQHIYKISLVKGLPFYGFHDKDHLYLKVFLYNPKLIKQAVELCYSGAILGQVLQPHEAHLNFTLQFFIDFNLFGMSNIDLQHVNYRRISSSQNSSELLQSSDNQLLRPESICYYEADCVASHIINRQRIGKGDGIENPGLEEVWNQEIERRKQLNLSLGSKSLTQDRTNDQTDTHYKFEKMYLIKMSNLKDKPVDTLTNKEKAMFYYPAESMEGSQFINAVDVSMHLPDSILGSSSNEMSKNNVDETLVGGEDNAIVDQTLALNLSLHYSQVLLDNEDLELVDMLQDMDDKPVEEDSILGTQMNKDQEADIDSDDAEYSRVFNEDTILLESCNSNNDTESTPSWNDSFWDGANIPQLDGTFDDDRVKKVRKRKRRFFRLGLSRPIKKGINSKQNDKESDSVTDESEIDEINASRDTIDSIPEIHLKRSIKVEPEISAKSDSICDLVNNITVKHKLDNVTNKRSEHQFEPKAGPSGFNSKRETHGKNDSESLSDQSSPENTSGVMSFYNVSKVFDMSIDNRNIIQNVQICDIEASQNNDINKTDSDLKIESIYNDNLTLVLTPKIRPPTKSYVISTLEKYNICKIKNIEPYYFDHNDVGDKVEIGQMVLKLQSHIARDQKPFENVLDTTSIEEWRQLLFLQKYEKDKDAMKPDALKFLLASNRHCILKPIHKSPTKKEVVKWIEQSEKKCLEIRDGNKEISVHDNELDNSQALGLNDVLINSSMSLEINDMNKSELVNTHQITMQPDGSFLCFGNNKSQTEKSPESPLAEVDFLTIMLLEVHTSIRGNLNPDPAFDAIEAIFITVTNDCPPNHFLCKSHTEIIIADSLHPPKLLDRCVFKSEVSYVNNESDILEKVIELIRLNDPDILCGYEVEMNSWGYLIERAKFFGLDMVKDISRITEKHRQKYCRDENEFEGRIIGRITFNIWRLFRHELALSSYSFENCMYEILKERTPTYTYAQLSEWWNDESRILRWIPVEYYLTRLSGSVRMLEKLDIINRTSELARLFGLQWWEVLSRGSQFRVESLMLRAARPLNLVALSPTVRQRAAMRAPECLPLIFEPESRFYTDPVIVLDFQSLYPSTMIAYNYCFSTCIGRVQNIDGDSDYEFGAWRLRIPKAKLNTLVKNGMVNWSPVGVGFVKPSVRRGVLPALLRRILAARQAVKKSMKLQTDEAVKKAMHSRQLGLKLIANVTYGYTAANFSGRMPCVEVGDSVVAKGRETLERAIRLVQSNKQWNAKVIYGDTDSMFVLVPGGTRAEAFELGQQIADAVTADNPSPVALKLEKVYQPCILQTKKRYVGYMYESADQENPVYEAKGIETVRRDGCPAGVKLLQRSLCTLFSSGDMSQVKRLVVRTLSQLAGGALPPHELFFTREYHGAHGYRPGAAAPPLQIANRIGREDRRAVPRPGWRVSWQVTAGAPHATLVSLARSPAELSADPSLRPHVSYYALRVLLPPLHRCLSLLGVNVFRWWNELSFSRDTVSTSSGGGGIARYLCRERCALCGVRAVRAVCSTCQTAHAGHAPQRVAALALTRLNVSHTHLHYCDQICKTCCGHANAVRCKNFECIVFWRRRMADNKVVQVKEIVTHLQAQFLEEHVVSTL